jgi:hypothetical protein
MQPSPKEDTDAIEPEAVAPDELITISRWELDALRAAAGGGPSPLEGPSTATPTAPVPAPAIAPKADRVADLERAYRDAVRDRELATALAGRPLVPGAAVQLIKLWRDDFDVYEADGVLKISSRDGRDVAKAVSDLLDEPEYSHFRPASSRGGAVVRGTGRAPVPGAPSAPRTLGEAALIQWREGAEARSDPASAPIGLRRR